MIRHLLVFALAFLVQGQSRAISLSLHSVADDVRSSHQDQREYTPTLPRMQFHDIDYRRQPWTLNTSRSWRAERGLEGRHLSLWASHGRYFDGEKNSWQWQRPYLFCTTEDMLTQGFVYPYLIPMLERAGAVVATPRERDWQWREAIVDGDTPSRYGTYAEVGPGWQDAGVGFGLDFQVLNDTIQPFTIGRARAVAVGQGAQAIWMPQIPAKGRYAVYISYANLPNAVPDALYTVRHAGQTTTFRVNQQMGGGTWVYLGTFLFEAGQGERNSVVLSAESDVASPGSAVVSCDAVRFGGGRSLIERCNPDVTETYVTRQVMLPDSLITASPVTSANADASVNVSTDATVGDIASDANMTVTDTIRHYFYGRGERSGLPRYLEAARYYTQWAGLADSLYNTEHGLNDYKDDLRARSHYINRLVGGSCYLPDTIGKRVPLELQFALHTDAGFHRDGRIYGSLAISTSYGDNGDEVYRSGLSRQVSADYATQMLNSVASDLHHVFGIDWSKRESRSANYSETRAPQVPSMIFELLSHQNFTDMCYAHDPNFKFHASRAIYKGLLREVARLHGISDPVVQPLPVSSLAASLLPSAVPDASPVVQLTWTGVLDPLEPSATPIDYVLYIKQGDDDWDNGSLTNGRNSARAVLQPGVHYQFRVSALNAGGESSPSAPVSVYVAPGQSNKQVLLVDAFDRLSGPARVVTPDSLGFDLMTDVGVSDGPNTTLTGQQQVFSRSALGQNGASSLGYGGGEYVGLAIAGNHHDGIALHASDLVAVAPDVTIVGISRAGFDLLTEEDLSRYVAIDYIAGLQADVPHNLIHYEVFPEATRHRLTAYAQRGGRLFVSGSRVGQADSLFLAQTLHGVFRATVSHRTDGTFRGLGLDIPVYNQPGESHYPCQTSDVIEPADATAFSAFAYGVNSLLSNAVQPTSEADKETTAMTSSVGTDHDTAPQTSAAQTSAAGYSAAVAWPSGLLMAFPYDCISDVNVRRSVMHAVAAHLNLTNH